jgi:hypothetical protein
MSDEIKFLGRKRGAARRALAIPPPVHVARPALRPLPADFDLVEHIVQRPDLMPLGQKTAVYGRSPAMDALGAARAWVRLGTVGAGGPEGTYGRSPAMDVLPDLSEMQRKVWDYLQAAQERTRRELDAIMEDVPGWMAGVATDEPPNRAHIDRRCGFVPMSGTVAKDRVPTTFPAAAFPSTARRQSRDHRLLMSGGPPSPPPVVLPPPAANPATVASPGVAAPAAAAAARARAAAGAGFAGTVGAGGPEGTGTPNTAPLALTGAMNPEALMQPATQAPMTLLGGTR